MKHLFFLILSLVMIGTASAQVTTSSINGKVTDSNGEVLVGATVIAVHNPTGTQYGALTNVDGRYNIQGMRTGGPYTITVSYVGYQAVELTDITLSLGEPRTFDVSLKESTEIDAVVVVSTANDRFNANKTGAAVNFSRGVIENVPTIDRSIADVARLSPLASSTKSSTGGISFAGANNRYNSFQIDGTVSNDVFGLTSSGTNGGQTSTNPISMETIEEIQVVIAPYDVRQSGFTGGGINAVTKSGTNSFRGSAYTYFRNNNLVGKGASGEKYAEQSTQTYGFTFGGPLVKDKLFFFVGGEYYKDMTPATVYDENNIDGFVTMDQLNQIARNNYWITQIRLHIPSMGKTLTSDLDLQPLMEECGQLAARQNNVSIFYSMLDGHFCIVSCNPLLKGEEQYYIVTQLRFEQLAALLPPTLGSNGVQLYLGTGDGRTFFSYNEDAGPAPSGLADAAGQAQRVALNGKN